ncbi:CPBP family intramembrane glutamic endopeptidase [Pseudonocardia parietis]|uniref:Membrane protease YdiL (CAAX protease family) n=1 Tax=Pseudonocardia parietis TaxID=570936 RepID=A0ABS4VSM3_9PSEU|nr:type II CAAX endopeptidase family protein [Pseudonocardia parietis]MBP2366906.1 membrane protease YdiL (CAAX protease family) [Pseudonocardia parietis]
MRGWLRVLGAIVVVVVLLGAGQFLWIGVNAVLGLPESGWQALALSNIVAFAPPALALAVWLWLREGRSVADLGFRVRRPALAVLAGAGTAVVLFVVSQLVVVLSDPVDPGTGDAAGPISPGVTVALVLLVTIAVQASTEELFLRGYLLGTARRHVGTAAAVLLSSVVFGLLHSLNPNASVAYVAATGALGLLLAFIALSGGGLWASCAFHAIWNAIPSVASAGETPDGPLDTGGSVANLAYVAVYLVFAALAGWSYRRRTRRDGAVRAG